MSGHSKWSTIKRQKAANDMARGKVFSKLSRAITIAVKTGGGPNMDSNYKLKVAIEAARAANMPKDNIDRAITKGEGAGEALEEVVYEGFAPGGVGVIIEATTDNRNRTGQEIKNILDKNGGNLGGPGSVAFNFEVKGQILVKKQEDFDTQMLTLIDAGVEDVQDNEDSAIVYVAANELFEARKKIEELGMEVISAELIRKPVNLVEIDEQTGTKVINVLEALEELDDVQKVYFNTDL